MGIISFLTKLVNRKRRRKNLQNAQISRTRNSRACPMARTAETYRDRFRSQKATVFSIYAFNSLTGRRTCCILSRSRTVTHPSVSESKS